VSDAGHDLKRELRLRPERPPVTRLSRTVLMSLATIAALTVSGALIWALFQNGAHSKAAEELHTTDSKQPPDELAALPRDYTVVKPAPQLGHPILADLAPPTVSAQANELVAPSDDHLAQEDEAARTSHLFFSSTTGSEQSTAVKSPAATSDERSATAVSGTDPVDPVASQNMQKQKLAFLDAPTDHTTVSPDRLENPASRYVVQAGSVIPAALITGIRSDLPGQVTGQVTEHVYDSPTGRYLLIPQGSKLIGLYDSRVALGQSRVLLVWTRLILPNGRSMVLERQTGADAEGFAGLQDEVDNHWGQLFMGAALSTLLGVGSQLGATDNDNAIAQAIRQGSSNSTSQIGQQLVGRDMSMQPTLTIRPGFPVRVIVNKDLVLAPYPTSGAT
jgi:type IV secretion system protein VirB10